MNILYVLCGFVLSSLGIYLMIRQIKVFIKGEEGKLGFDIQLLFGGIMATVGGIIMIAQNI
jgi:hypothetical protein